MEHLSQPYMGEAHKNRPYMLVFGLYHILARESILRTDVYI